MSAQAGSVPVRFDAPSGTEHTGPIGQLQVIDHPPVRVASATADDSITVSALLAALKRRWLAVLVLSLVAAAATGWTAARFMPDISTARTLLHVSAVRPVILYDTPGGHAEFANYQREQLGMLRSRLVLRGALAKPGIATLPSVQAHADPIAWLEKETLADYSIAPEIMRITLKGDDPQDVVSLLNAIRETYLEEVVNRDRKERQARLDQLKTLWTGYQQQLRQERKVLRNLAETVGSRDVHLVTAKRQDGAVQANGLQGELLRVQTHLRQLRREASEPISDSLDLAAIEAALEDQAKADLTCQQLQTEISRLESVATAFKAVAVRPNEQSDFRRLQHNLDVARQALRDRRASLRENVVRRLQLKEALDRRTRGERRRQEQRQLEDEEEILRAQIERAHQEAAAVAKALVDIEQHQDAISRVDELGKKAAAQMNALEVELGAPPRARLLEEAVIQPAAESKRLAKIGLATMAAFFAVVIAIGWLELRTGRVGGLDDIERRFTGNVVTGLPMLRAPLADPAMPLAAGDGSWAADRQWCNAVDGTRALLLAPLPNGKPRVLMVTSALPQEGKTTLSAHLAQSCARAGFRTLLVDADLRNPNVHRLLKVRPGPGLGELIAGAVEMREVVRNGPVGGLDIITGGQIDSANVPAAVQQVVPRLLEEFKQQYHVIIIDTPPILPVADALVLGPHTDGAVLSAMRNVSRVPAIRLACERLTQLRTPILGVVIAGVASHLKDYYHPAYSER